MPISGNTPILSMLKNGYLPRRREAESKAQTLQSNQNRNNQDMDHITNIFHFIWKQQLLVIQRRQRLTIRYKAHAKDTVFCALFFYTPIYRDTP